MKTAEELENLLIKYSNAYYSGKEIISDIEYDELVEELRSINPDSEYLDTVVGKEEKIDGFEETSHIMTTGTLKKCRNEEEFNDWFSKHPGKYIVETKIDGAGVELIYKEGRLIKAISRGNGDIGFNITENVKKIKGVSAKLNENYNGSIRGEMIMFHENFEKYFSDMKNPRNACAGVIKRKDGEDCKKINFIAYDILPEDKNFLNQKDVIDFLCRNEFTTPSFDFIYTVEKALTFRSIFNKTRNELPYDIDGIVVKPYKIDYEDNQRHTPLNSVAIKFDLISAVSILKDIKWQLAGSILSPVAYFDPVELNGTTVKKASLANVNKMDELGIWIGCKVEITKRGEIIPKVEKVLDPKISSFYMPIKCPTCNSDLILDESGFLRCPNKNCSSKVGHKFARIFSTLNIKGAGDAFIDSLCGYDACMENSNVDVYQFFTFAEDNNVEMFRKWAGGVNGDKILNQVKEAMSKPITTAKFLSLFDYDGLDEKKFNQLGSITLQDFVNMTKDEIMCHKGFADIMADKIMQMKTDLKYDLLKLRLFFIIKNDPDEERRDSFTKVSSELNGKKICFTGKSVISRTELFEITKEVGAIPVDSVTKETDLLVTDEPDSGSAKNKKSQKLGTKIISSIDFLKMAKKM